MANLHNIPAELQLLIQDEKENILRASLRPELGFRQIAERENLPIRIGETLTKFRGNLLAPNTTPLTPGTFNNDLDNGMSPKTRKAEQFSLSPRMYGDTMDLNKFNNITALIEEYIHNAAALTQQAEASIDILARNALMAAYMGGHTFVTTTDGASNTSVAVDDVTGFETKMVNGVPTAVSGSNALAITINGVANTVTGVAVDGTNTSRQPYGRSGVLTLGSATADTQGHIVNAVDRPFVARPYSSNVVRASNLAIAAGDIWTFRQLRDAKTYLRNNGVPMINGKYNVHTSEDGIAQLFLDEEFKNAFNATGTTQAYGSGTVRELLDLRFITSHQHRTQAAGASPSSAKLHLPIMVGDGALLEGEYTNAQEMASLVGPAGFMLHDVSVLDGISFIDRSPLDRLGLNMAQSWMWVGDFCVPTDSLVDSTVLPTASTSRLKRAVVMPHSE